MKAFGFPPFTYNDIVPVVATPVGEKCGRCREEIVEGDRGFITPHVEDPAEGVKEIPRHQECVQRDAVGSVGHLLQICSCFGGEIDDLPGLTARENARAAVALYEFLRVRELKSGGSA